MKVGVPSEIKAQESRVGLTPASVQELVNHGHEVIIQDNAGFGAGFENTDYEKTGAKIAPSAGDIFNDADMIVKVKEPLTEDGEIVYKYGVHYKDAYYPCKLIDELSTISFYDNVYPIPNEYVGYLERKYGKSWQTPKKDWSVILEDKSLL